jgi:Short C-terminal domain
MARRRAPMRRGRPLLRTAAIGGTAYYAGKKGAQGAQREASQEARISELEAQQATAAPAPASGGLSADAMEQLQKLGQLHEQGILTDAEFEVQKQKLLQGM